MKKKIPQFKDKKQEAEFWQKNDSVDFVNWSKAENNIEMPNLKPSTKTISLRLSESMLNDLKTVANKKDVPYQSFIKVIIDERLKSEQQKTVA
jgi:predicted DNA binding CopG/RHH family protein